MKVKDVIEEIRFATNTVHDLSGRSVNRLFTNKSIVRQLKFSLDEYAQRTKAIEGIYSLPIDTESRIVPAPTDVIRSMGYRFIMTWISGQKYPMNIKGHNQVQTEFPYDNLSGIPRWVLPWGDDLNLYPLPSESYSTTTLPQGISKTETTITVSSTSGFPSYQGRATIDNEKFTYKTKDDTNFYNCVRGVEGTTAAAHSNSATVKENNCHIYYYKRHFEIPVFDDETIDPDYKDREMEVDDVHLLSIINRTAYLLLKKVDTTRANAYKVDWENLLQEAEHDIDRGRNDIVHGANIRQSYDWEGNTAFDVF